MLNIDIKDYEYITEIPSQIAASDLADEKKFQIFFMDALDYIYKNKADGNHVNDKYELWLDPKTGPVFATTFFNELKCKKFLNQFREHFDQYQDLLPFYNLRAFALSDRAITQYLKETSPERTVFDINKYINDLTENGQLKRPQEISSNENLTYHVTGSAKKLTDALESKYGYSIS